MKGEAFENTLSMQESAIYEYTTNSSLMLLLLSGEGSSPIADDDASHRQSFEDPMRMNLYELTDRVGAGRVFDLYKNGREIFGDGMSSEPGLTATILDEDSRKRLMESICKNQSSAFLTTSMDFHLVPRRTCPWPLCLHLRRLSPPRRYLLPAFPTFSKPSPSRETRCG